MGKSTDTEEDNVTGTGYSDKTTQFPSTYAELGAEQTEAVHDSSPKAATPKTTTQPSSPPPTAVSPEFAYVPADPAQLAAQMLGKVSSIHFDQSDVLMVDVATGMPAVIKEVPSSEAAEDVMVAAPLVYSGKVLEVQVVSQTSVHVDLGSQPKENEAELSKASSVPLQDEQEPPAYVQAPEVPLQADIEVMSTVRISSIHSDVPMTEGVVYVEQLPEQIVIPFTDQVACLKENEQSPSVSPKPVVEKTTSGMSKKSSLTILGRRSLGKTLHPRRWKANLCSLGKLQKEYKSGTSVKSSSGPFPSAPEGLTAPEIEPEGEGIAEEGLMKPAMEASEPEQPPPYSNMWTLYCLTDKNQQSHSSLPPAPGPFPQATLYISKPKDLQFLQHPPTVTSPIYAMDEICSFCSIHQQSLLQFM
uniref:Calcium binding tyrosine phosphorylation regulated n=1 Tax=Saimiri boliviensis boliviensis TaxID=39432 RepID=A0A2K6UI01_SAIBB